MEEKKREAEAAVDLMAVQYERNCSDEEKRNGLIIIKATYGLIHEENTSIDGQYLSLPISICECKLKIFKTFFSYKKWFRPNDRCNCATSMSSQRQAANSTAVEQSKHTK